VIAVVMESLLNVRLWYDFDFLVDRLKVFLKEAYTPPYVWNDFAVLLLWASPFLFGAKTRRNKLVCFVVVAAVVGVVVLDVMVVIYYD
jgi:hypothetical protein